MSTTRTVYEVFYYDARATGAAGDCSHVARFGRKGDAERFAQGRRAGYGDGPATVERVDVPRALAARWGIA
jgi:hypothetical protein